MSEWRECIHPSTLTRLLIEEGIFDTIAGLTPNPGNVRDTANVRFYCDNDPFNRAPNSAARWQLVPDRANNPQPNSGRTVGVDAEVFDQLNWIRRAADTQGCLDVDTQAETYTEAETDAGALNYNNQPAPVNLAQQRTTVTVCLSSTLPNSHVPFHAQSLGCKADKICRQICDYLLNAANFPLKAFAPPYVAANHPLDTMSLAGGAYSSIVSAIHVHELSHINPLGTDDSKGQKKRGGSYGWTNCMHMSAAQAVGQVFPPGQGQDTYGNGENYMFFAILARCANRQYKLSTSPVPASKGVLLHDTTLPPKMMRRRVSWARLHAREYWHGFGAGLAQSLAQTVA